MRGNARRLVALCAAMAAAIPAAAYADTSFYYRFVKPLKDAVSAAMDPSPETPTVDVWRLEGSQPLQMSTTLGSLGVDSHTTMAVDGQVIGGSPPAYWAPYSDNHTIQDLCANVVALGGYQCAITEGFNRVGLCIVRTTNLGTPLVFSYFDNATTSFLPGPAALLGTRYVSRQTKAFASDYCLVPPDDN